LGQPCLKKQAATHRRQQMEEGEQIDVGCGNYEDSDLFTAVEKYAGLIDRG